ncbi:MAG: nucleotidyltransferase domain-containing protein [Parvularculaceae bacterium]|nr:nucleotidyltransferase domain-containing protein [Parvularculaceae bacterium]
MMTRGTLSARRSQILELAERDHVVDVRVFGSVARGNATEDSDVDLLIKPRRGCSLFDLGGLLEELQQLLGCRVDLVTEDGLKPRLREQVLTEAIPLPLKTESQGILGSLLQS